MLCLSTVKEFALVIAISISTFLCLIKSISRLCTSYQIHFHFTGSLIKEFRSTGSPSTKSFIYSKHILISLVNQFRSLHVWHVGNWLSPIRGPIQSPRPRFGDRRLTFSMFFIFRANFQLPIILDHFITEFGQMLQSPKFVAKQVYSTLSWLCFKFNFKPIFTKQNNLFL